MSFDLTDMSGTFSVFDVTVSLVLSFALCSVVGWVYKRTHRNISYSQSYVQTLVVIGMVISVIMLVVGSNVARAFALVGALSVVRFRNAIKETRDVGFIFAAMAIGMATGTRFYLLAIAATVAILAVVVLMYRFNWFALDVRRQVVKVQVPPDPEFQDRVVDVLLQHTVEYDLVSVESIRGGALNELFYSVRLKPKVGTEQLVEALGSRNAGQKVTVLTGYDQTDL